MSAQSVLYGPTLLPGSTEWWLRRLSKALADRQARIQKYSDYYAGIQPMAFASAKFREAFGTRFPEFSSNFMALVVDTHRDRLQVQGIRYGDQKEGDQDAWDWWQRNHLDSESAKLHTESLVKEIAYVLVWPNEQGEPEASIEDPRYVIVESVPGQSWKRRAALKRFVGEDGFMHAELYLPGVVHKYRSQQSISDFSVPGWDRYVDVQWTLVESVDGLPNEVPMIPFPNRPRADGTAESEIKMVLSNQDAINKLRMDALVAAEFAAFRQRWAIGLDIPLDPVTKQPIEPFRSAVDRLWVVPPPTPEEADQYGDNLPEVKFGEFGQSDVSGLLKQIEQEIQAIASITRTPPHYLINMGTLPSGESLKTVETGLVAKVQDSMLHKGEGWEEVFRVQFAWRDDRRGKVTNAEIIWRDPESRNDAVLTDSVLKQVQMGLPFEKSLEVLGYGPTEILRIMQMREAEELRAAAKAAALAASAPQPAANQREVPGAPGGAVS